MSLSIKDTEKLINGTVAEAIQLPCDHKMVHQQKKSWHFYPNNSLTVIEGVKSERKPVLLAENGINLIHKILKLKGDAITKKAAKTPCTSTTSLFPIVATAKRKMMAKKVPPTKYLLDADNPFKEKMDWKDKWKEKTWITAIQNELVFLSGVCINYHIMHAVIKTRYFYKEKKHGCIKNNYNMQDDT